MASETQILSREMILSAYKAALQLSRVLYKSTLFMQNEPNFSKSQVNVNLYNTTNYENKSDWTLGENEPKTNPIKANLHLTAENAEYAEKKDIGVSDCSIEKYALYPISPCSGLGHPVDLRTWRLMENKPNLPEGKIDAMCVFTKDY